MSYPSTPAPPPGYGGTGPQGEPPNNYLVWAILTTLFCFLFTGIVSIVYATQVSSRWQAGDVAGAHDASGKAKMWAIITAVIGILGYAVVAVFVFAVFGWALSETESAR